MSIIHFGDLSFWRNGDGIQTMLLMSAKWYHIVALYRMMYNQIMNDLHVYPIDDIFNHKLVGTTCQCGPKIQVEGATLIVVHNSFDKRELFENGEEKQCLNLN
jgi:hypothetical protein